MLVIWTHSNSVCIHLVSKWFWVVDCWKFKQCWIHYSWLRRYCFKIQFVQYNRMRSYFHKLRNEKTRTYTNQGDVSEMKRVLEPLSMTIAIKSTGVFGGMSLPFEKFSILQLVASWQYFYCLVACTYCLKTKVTYFVYWECNFVNGFDLFIWSLILCSNYL